MRDFQLCGMCDQRRLRSACAYAQSDRSVCWSFAYFRIIKLLTGRRLEFLSLKVCFNGSSGSVLVRVPHCWRSRVAAHIDLVASYC